MINIGKISKIPYEFLLTDYVMKYSVKEIF